MSEHARIFSVGLLFRGEGEFCRSERAGLIYNWTACYLKVNREEARYN